MTSLYKEGSRLASVNYQLISLTSVTYKKKLKKIVKNSIMKFFELKHSSFQNQHRFRNIKSCTTNLLEAMNYAIKIISEEDLLDILFIDLEEAIDKVSQQK